MIARTVAIALLFAFGPVLVSAAATRGEVQLDLAISPGGLTQSIDLEIVASADRVFAVWSEVADSDDVYYSFSDDAGETWLTAPLWVDVDSTTNDTEPFVAAEGDLVCIAWFHKPETGGPEDISAVVSTDGGLSFGPRINISGTLYNDQGDADLMSVAVVDPFIYVLFEDDLFDPNVSEDLFVVASRDRGQSFDQPRRVNDTFPGTIDVDEPRIATTGSDAYVVWKDERAINDRIFFTRTSDGGVTWNATNALITYLPTGVDVDAWPVVAVSGDHVYVAWLDNRNGPPGNDNNQVFFARSADKGATWDSDRQVGGSPLGSWAYDLDMVAAAGHVHIAFRDTRNGGSYDVHVASSSDRGQTFPDVETLDADLGTINTISPRLAVADETVFCCYQDQTERIGRDVAWVGFSTHEGKTGTWSTKQMSEGPSAAYDIDTNRIAATDSRHLIVAWEDDRANSPYDIANDIFASGCVVAAPLLSANRDSISESAGGTVDFAIEAGSHNGARQYVILGSMTGTTPGTPLPGGYATLPLNWDGFTRFVFNRLNMPLFMNFRGNLTGSGSGAAQLNAWPVPGFGGITMHFAYALGPPWDFVSNPVAIDIVP